MESTQIPLPFPKRTKRLEQISLAQLLTHFDKEVHLAITMLANNPDTEGLVVYRNEDMCSRNLGHTTCVCYGQKRTFKCLDTIAPWLNDLPSQREYPIAYWDKATDKPVEAVSCR